MSKKFKVLIVGILSLLAALAVNIYKSSDSHWNPLPVEGIISGDYYRVEKNSEYGRQAIFEGVKDKGRIVKTEYNEVAGGDSSSRYYQGTSKRLSEYNFHMMHEGDEGISWAEVILDIEGQMVEKQSLAGEFDILAGCTHYVEYSMLPLGRKLEEKMMGSSSKRYYELTKNLGGGIYGNLRVIIEDNKIISCRYDELFAPKKKDIVYKDLKDFYRQSKYHSVEYRDPSGTGFNIQMDELDRRVVATQNMLDIEGLPATKDSPKGYKKKNPAWENYLVVAKLLLKEIKKDSPKNYRESPKKRISLRNLILFNRYYNSILGRSPDSWLILPFSFFRIY